MTIKPLIKLYFIFGLAALSLVEGGNLKDELAVLENDNIRDVDQKRFAFQSGVAKVLPANDAVKQDAAFRMLVSYHPIKRKLRAIIERLETAHRKLCECMTYPNSRPNDKEFNDAYDKLIQYYPNNKGGIQFYFGKTLMGAIYLTFMGGYAKYEKIQQIYSILDNTKGNDIEKCNELGTDVAVLELFRRLHPQIYINNLQSLQSAYSRSDPAGIKKYFRLTISEGTYLRFQGIHLKYNLLELPVKIWSRYNPKLRTADLDVYESEFDLYTTAWSLVKKDQQVNRP